jgi:hypothetical protein
MEVRELKVLSGPVGRSAIAMLAALLSANAAWGGTQAVTATKDTSTPAQVTEATFSMLIPQKIFWTAQYLGTPTQGHSFYLSTVASNLADIKLTGNGALGGNMQLAAGTYHISIRLALMGPGNYTVKFDPTGNGANNGDPHLTTVDGVHYDFQSAGEFVALRDGDGMEIQTRQTPVSTASAVADPYTGLTSGVSLNSGVAARVGKHRVSFQFDPQAERPADGLTLRIDGVVTKLSPRGMSLGPGGRVSPAAGSGIRIDFPNGTVLVVTPNWWAPQRRWYLNLDVFHTPARMGIMGVIAPRGWLPALPDGGSLGTKPTTAHQRYVALYQKFADAWRVTDATSLFDYGSGASTATFTNPSWPPETKPYVVAGETPVKPVSLAVAQKACAGVTGKALKADCVFDVQVLGDVGLAKGQRVIAQVRLGTTATEVGGAKGAPGTRAGLMATVIRLSAVGTATPAGTVQFSVDGEDVGAPVKLDPKGVAYWNPSRLRSGERVAARYLPAKGGVFMASESVEFVLGEAR